MRNADVKANHQILTESFEETARILTELAASQRAQIVRAADLMASAIRAGRKIIWFGNGGSATQSQHMAAEFVGRFSKERRSLPSLSLTENMASVTAIANDYQYELIFARQLEGLGQPGDVAIGLSTSGASRNVLAGLRKARELGMVVLGLTGSVETAMPSLCDVCLAVPSTNTARIQEAHLAIGHVLCALVEDVLT
jgi:D-sedoheptulose 7-phosphate isomerase